MSKYINESIILCGGLGTRFREVSEQIPKALAVVSGKPILSWLINDLTNIGIKKIVLATGYLSEDIEEFIENNNFKNCLISKEENPLGTGGAILNAQKYINKKNFFVLNGDSRIKFNLFKLLNFHEENYSDISILLSSKTKGNDFGSVKISKNKIITCFSEKKETFGHSLVNTGVYCMKKSLFTSLKQNTKYSLEKDLIPLWIKEKKIFGHIVNIPFTDIGTKKRFTVAKFE